MEEHAKPSKSQGGEDMYWNKEFNFQDKEVKHLWEEYAAVWGALTAVVVLAIVIAAL